jgi:hypothetical protein
MRRQDRLSLALRASRSIISPFRNHRIPVNKLLTRVCVTVLSNVLLAINLP